MSLNFNIVYTYVNFFIYYIIFYNKNKINKNFICYKIFN